MLTIYSASAGTGKTHTLTGRYLSLLFNGKDAHRRILAITFTNKATAEMKNRIITELFKLADGQPSDFADVIAHSRSVPVIANEAKQSPPLSQTTLQTTARKLLIDILHDYSTFNISTIDHFFQRTVRAFTREIGLQGNYQIELDENVMLNEAVDNMMSELEKDDNGELVDWLIQFAESKIDAGKSRDVRQDIVKLGQELFKEAFKTKREIFGNCLNEKNVLKNYRTDIYKLIRSKESAARSLGERGLALMLKHGLQPTDMTGKRNSPFNLFAKLARGEVAELTKGFLKLPDNVDAYCAKNDKPHIKTAAIELYNDGMNNLVGEVVNFLTNTTDYCTAKAIAANFHALGILADLSAQLYKWREDNNSLFISDTTELLNKIIDGSEIPFIYEKTGTKIEHYMIDEFQDTSAMQWDNLRPLVKDSLDAGRANLIVGDVKQSIYRFRNSDWSILSSQVERDLPNATERQFLDVNWRSCRYIVEFNNLVFHNAPVALQAAFNEEMDSSSLNEDERDRFSTLILTAYTNATQKVAAPFVERRGHVKALFFEDTKERSWIEQSMEELPLIIEQLQDSGYELRDIAILTRTSDEGARAAETLLRYREAHPSSAYSFDIITEDTLLVASSTAVRWLLAMLRLLCDPANSNCRSLAQAAYAIMTAPPVIARNEAISTTSAQPVIARNEAISSFFQPIDEARLEQLQYISGKSLYETVETMHRLYENEIPDSELIFIQAFIDAVADYSNTRSADIVRFLEWWDETGCKSKIKTPDSQNAIRIMTIHKSKGLGFKAVIIPQAKWDLEPKPDPLWCATDRQPFNSIGALPVNYSKNLKNTVFARYYFNEKLFSWIDNLNLMYVAFTRAKEELVIMAPKPKTDTVSIHKLLYDSIQPSDEDGVYEVGEWGGGKAFQSSKETESGTQTSGTQTSGTRASCPHQTIPGTQASRPHDIIPCSDEIPVTCYKSISPDGRTQLRLRGNGTLTDDAKRRYGLLMHDILAAIHTRDDIAEAIARKVASGEVEPHEATPLQHNILHNLSRNDVAAWYDGSMRVMNETEILFGHGQTRRPDRIMFDEANRKVIVADYKFGDVKEPAHRLQTVQYRALLNDMGFDRVECFLWYITLGEVEKCVF
jgi:ATP-dependent exoDNAse (exonuclease V) beta subunit